MFTLLIFSMGLSLKYWNPNLSLANPQRMFLAVICSLSAKNELNCLTSCKNSEKYKKVFLRAAFLPELSSGGVKTLEKSGKNPEAKIRRETIRIKNRKRYKDRKKNTVGRSLQKTFRTRYKYSWAVMQVRPTLLFKQVSVHHCSQQCLSLPPVSMCCSLALAGN